MGISGFGERCILVSRPNSWTLPLTVRHGRNPSRPCGLAAYNRSGMKITRGGCAWIVLAATLAGAVWVYTYRVAVTVEYIDRFGYRFHPSEVVRESPWWGAPATVALIVIGAATIMWLLPERRRLILRRFANHSAHPS
jgi:hypothetical protein